VALKRDAKRTPRKNDIEARHKAEIDRLRARAHRKMINQQRFIEAAQAVKSPLLAKAFCPS
jgi:hypothetical protein